MGTVHIVGWWWCALCNISRCTTTRSGAITYTHRCEVDWAVTMDDVSCGGAAYLLDVVGDWRT
jgi:hypothetical protein